MSEAVKILDLLQHGLTHRVIADRLKVSRRKVLQVSKDNGIKRRAANGEGKRRTKAATRERGPAYSREVNPEEAVRKATACAEAGMSKVAKVEAEVSDFAIPLMERGRFQCSFPIGVPARPALQMCCGAAVPEGQPGSTETYCPHHATMATSSIKPKDGEALSRLARAG